MSADREQAGGRRSGTVITLVIGFLVGLLFDEAFLRSGYHPVALAVDPTLLKSAVANDPELEAVLRLDELQEESAAQQKALTEARRQFEMLESRYHNLEQDFHAAINMERPETADAPRLPLTPDCILAVRAARQRACPCDATLCPVLYKGETCEEPEEDLPECLTPFEVPYQPPDGEDFHMWTLNRETITNKNMHLLNLGKYDDKEDVVVQLTSEVMQQLPAKEVFNPKTYRSCAIVGSSDNLLRQFLGDEINDHDLVVRFNGATTKGFEKHVGRVTNVRFVTNPWLGFREYPQETVVYLDPNSGDPLYGCDRVTECTNATSTVTKFVEELKLFRQLRVAQLHPKVARWMSTPYRDGAQWYKPSSGFQVAMLLSHVCETIDLYGFAGMEPRKYFDHESIQEKFLGAVGKWAQEVKDGVPVSYPFASEHFRHRSLLSGAAEGLEEAVGNPLRKLLGKGGRKRAPAAAPPPVVINVEEVPNYAWERQCQEDMVLKGLITVHGVHVELLPQAMGKQQPVAQEVLDLKAPAGHKKGKRG
eukprot:jgi/Tetstr1/435945/TSEL_024826.t1